MDKDGGIFKLPESGSAFKLDEPNKCLDPSHNFPSHLHIPQGHGYRHVCPKCGEVKVATNPIAFNA